MTPYHWSLLIAFGICFVSCGYQFFRIIFLGLPKDYSKPLGSVEPAIAYSFTKAMLPTKKETAYLHLPTYTAGILFHVGTFISFALLLPVFLNLQLPGIVLSGSFIFLLISSLCGLGIFFKRLIKTNLKSLSSPDDYISNLFVTCFQVFTSLNLIFDITHALYVMAAILFLYIPVSKLRHTIYFFTSRIHLGFFYGWRGVWPSGRRRI